LVFLLLASASLHAQSAGATRRFTDSAGRTVDVPLRLERIAPSGVLAQIVLYSMVPERILGWSARPTELMKPYLPARHWNLPTFGQYYGKNVSLNLEALIAAGPQVIIDLGEAKKTIREDMDALQKQTGIPVVFIEATLDTFDEAYTMLGELTGEKAAAAILSRYCSKVVGNARKIAASIPAAKKVRVYYGEGSDGLQANAAGSIHADIIELVGADNVVKLAAAPVSGGTPVSMEQLLLWDPDVIIVGPGSVYGAAAQDPLWKNLRAVQNGRIYEVPQGPYNWMARPPAVNRLMGAVWLGRLFYPELHPVDVVAETITFYRLFYHYELSQAEARRLLERSGVL
jgi:iron complex transport system substrate-binding protein